MSAEQFMELVKEHNGFEFFQAYRDDVDHIIGGKENTYWYIIMKKRKILEAYIGIFCDGVWKDRYEKGTKKTMKEMPAGSTIQRAAEHAYLFQNEAWVKNRNPRLIQDSHPHFHYVYGFGDKALDVSEQYGVTIAYSDIKDPSVGFHLRDLHTGSSIDLP